MKKIIVFDMDDTLSPAKSPADKEMLELLEKLLEKYKVAIITWWMFETIKMQILDWLNKNLENLYILPTIWTQWYEYKNENWERKYVEWLQEGEVKYITKILNEAIQTLGLKPKQTWWDIIENRISQITYSWLGQKAPLEAKRKFDPDKKIRWKIVNEIKDKLKDYSIWIWGTTSIDITRKWLDKSYGIQKIIENLKLKKEDILFIWDALFEWWNDYPVKKYGIETIQVENPEDTKKIVINLL